MQQKNSFQGNLATSIPGRSTLLILVLLFLGCGGYATRVSVGADYSNTPDDVSYLDQYGVWVDVAPYGSVWEPSVGPDWQPFSYGHWVWTDNGWAWVSYEPYGWLVYHYGNWDFQPDIGWFWIEGSDWSPAQAEWINYDGCVGWAPLPPLGRRWADPWDERGFHAWNMVRERDFNRDNIGQYRLHKLPQPQNPDRRDVFYKPIAVGDFEKTTGKTVRPIKLERSPTPVIMHPGHRAERTPFAPPPVDRTSETQKQPRNQEENRGNQASPAGTRPEGNQQGEARPSGTQPEKNTQGETRPSENQPKENPPVQLRRMVLPESEKARVEKHRAAVERNVLINKKNQPANNGRTQKTRNKK